MSALRSDSREWPIRMGVPAGDEGEVGDRETEDDRENGLAFGLSVGGQRIRIMSACTCSKVVVTVVRASGVIPDHLVIVQ